MRSLALAALITAAALLPGSVGLALSERSQTRATEARMLTRAAADESSRLISLFEKARAVALIAGRDRALEQTLTGDARPDELVRAKDVLKAIGPLFPGQATTAALTDAEGRELARVDGGNAVAARNLVTDSASQAFFGPAMASPPSEVYQAEPHDSASTGHRVIPTATPIIDPHGNRLGLLYFELEVRAFRQQVAASAENTRVAIIDAIDGATVVDTKPDASMLTLPAADAGTFEVGEHLAAARRMPFLAGNANRWVVVSVGAKPLGGVLSGFGPAPWVMLALSLILAILAFAGLRASNRELRHQANHDLLTGLPNRRSLLADLRRVAARDEDSLLVLFDLNGFKGYNDTFGHLAGDALLTRLGTALDAAVGGWGRAYRLGGDEFCILAQHGDGPAVEAAAANALVAHGDGFDITASYGSVRITAEARDPEQALLLADQRMYRQKAGGRTSVAGQTQAVLLQALTERHPGLEDHSGGVAELAQAIAAQMGLDGADVENVRVGAELHDIGKVAIPDSIISKPGPLDAAEWAFMHRHTIIGERILLAAPALAHVAPLVRSSHERWDGGGYPDGLAGEEIPLGARIVAVCDSFDAMVSARPYAPSRHADEALEELRRCAGTQFDPAIVAAFERVWAQVRNDAGRPVVTA